MKPKLKLRFRKLQIEGHFREPKEQLQRILLHLSITGNIFHHMRLVVDILGQINKGDPKWYFKNT